MIYSVMVSSCQGWDWREKSGAQMNEWSYSRCYVATSARQWDSDQFQWANLKTEVSACSKPFISAELELDSAFSFLSAAWPVFITTPQISIFDLR